MYKGKIIHSEINRVISSCRHYDKVSILDFGMSGGDKAKEIIDLGWKRGNPMVMDVAKTIGEYWAFDKILMMDFVPKINPALYKDVQDSFPGVEIELVPVADFKAAIADSKAVIRTGDNQDGANLVFVAGVAREDSI
ncbi:MAG: RbsD/FucU domain-containing protein [Lachnospiraceae bacterium]|nr:RbsD/FucU domain-containing protein [Lachnospiraceae bacterium]MDD3797021.1 RbsD/FucU domain-containing protein [Lachnospiraceae bacterium]